MDTYERRHSGFSGLFSIRLDAQNPHEFSEKIESKLKELQQDEEDGQSVYTPDELKRLVRHYTREYDNQNPDQTFNGGAYMPFFLEIRAKSPEQYEILKKVMNFLHQVCQKLSVLDKDANKGNLELDLNFYNQLVYDWDEISKLLLSIDDKKTSQIMLWKIFEPIVRGTLQVNEFRAGENVLHYTSITKPELQYVRLNDHRRQEIIERFWESGAKVLQKQFTIERLISKNKNLPEELKVVFLKTLETERKKGEGEKLSTYLERDTEIIAFSEANRIDEYFAMMMEFLSYLSKDVFEDSSHPYADYITSYINFILDRYLHALKYYCEEMRKIKDSQPFLSDIILEPHLLKNELIDGTQEPSLLQLFEKWHEIQEDMEKIAKYKGEKFSFSKKHKEIQRKLKRRSQKVKLNRTIAFTPDAVPLSQTSPGRKSVDKKTRLGVPAINQASTKTVLGFNVAEIQRKIAETSKPEEDKQVISPTDDSKVDQYGETVQALPVISEEPATRPVPEPLAPVDYEDKIHVSQLSEMQSESMIRQEFRKHKEMIRRGLIKFDGFELYNSLIKTIKEPYGKTPALLKTCAIEACRFYSQCIKDIPLTIKAKASVYLNINKFLDLIHGKFEMPGSLCYKLQNISSKSEKTINEMRLPEIKGKISIDSISCEFPKPDDFPLVKESLTEDELTKIQEFQNDVNEIVDKLEKFSYLLLIDQEVRFDNPIDTFMLYLRRVKDTLDKKIQDIRLIHERLKQGWFSRKVFRSKKALHTEKFFNAIEKTYTSLWENAVLPSFVAYGTIVLGEGKSE